MDVRFDFLSLDEWQREAIEKVYRMMETAQVRGGWDSNDARAINDVWRGLHYLMTPVEVQVKTKADYDVPIKY